MKSGSARRFQSRMYNAPPFHLPHGLKLKSNTGKTLCLGGAALIAALAFGQAVDPGTVADIAERTAPFGRLCLEGDDCAGGQAAAPASAAAMSGRRRLRTVLPYLPRHRAERCAQGRRRRSLGAASRQRQRDAAREHQGRLQQRPDAGHGPVHVVQRCRTASGDRLHGRRRATLTGSSQALIPPLQRPIAQRLPHMRGADDVGVPQIRDGSRHFANPVDRPCGQPQDVRRLAGAAWWRPRPVGRSRPPPPRRAKRSISPARRHC